MMHRAYRSGITNGNRGAAPLFLSATRRRSRVKRRMAPTEKGVRINHRTKEHAP